MLRIEASVPGAGRIRPAGSDAPRAGADTPARALMVMERAEAPSSPGTGRRGEASPSAGFVAQLIVGADPSLRPSRLERARAAVTLYAAAALRVA